jgi:hypothetical protein
MSIQAVAVFNNWREIFVEGPIMITFTANGATIVIGDNFLNDQVLRSEIGSEILNSAAALFEPSVREKVLALARSTSNRAAA